MNKENKYIKASKEIREIAVKENVDVAEQREFLEACRKYTLDKIVKEMR